MLIGSPAMRVLLVRFSWFVVVGAYFFQHDMCLGGTHEDPVVPKDAAPDADKDAGRDARLGPGPSVRTTEPGARRLKPATAG